MTSFNEYLAHGNAWLFIPAAIVLGALHGLEPGHSKTMMAAFIVAIRGTVRQAVLLGLSATISHTLVIWTLALVGLHYAGRFDPEKTEPYFQMVTGVIVIGMAAWMFLRTRREIHAVEHHHHHHHDHDHGDEQNDDHNHHHHDHDERGLLQNSQAKYEDEHAREHAVEIENRFANQHVTTWQIVLFGLTGGLLPCPAAFAVLLVCLQLKEFTLGFALVLAFSVGLALTLVGVGTIAAVSVGQANKRIKGFGELARKAPYVSSAMLVLIGLVIGLAGLRAVLR